MANYHLNMSYGKVGKTNAHFEYITATGKYTGKEKELAYETHNMPKWVTSAKEFWDLADKNERSNGRTYREVRISLPEELTRKQNIELLNEFLKESFSNHHYSVVIHDKESQPGFDNVQKHKNIHAHIMFCPRVIDNIDRKDPGKYFKKANSKNPECGGAKKDEKWNTVERLEKLRKDWEILQNNHLEKYNINERVTCKSLKDQRQEALEKGDFDKFEQLNREPINIDRTILKKTNKTEFEKEAIKAFNLKREIKFLKDEIYEETVKKREKNRETINQFNSSLNEKEKENAYIKLMNIRNTLDKNNNIITKLQNTNINNEVYANLIPNYKEKFDELNDILNSQEYFTDEEFNSLADRYTELKLMESSIDKDSFEKEKENVISNIAKTISKLEKENNVLNEEIQDLFAKNEYNKKFHEDLTRHYSNNDSQKEINNIILATREKASIERKLRSLDSQLSNSRRTTLNILSKKRYVPLEKEINKLRNDLESKLNLGETEQANILRELLSKKEKELKNIEISCTRDMNKFVRIKESLEKKLDNNKTELNIKLKAINTSIADSSRNLLLSNKDVKKHLNEVTSNNKKVMEENKLKIDRLKFIKKSLKKDVKELEVIAYLSLTKGKYGKLQDNFSKNIDKIEQLDIELIKLKENKLFNIFAIRKLEKEKAELEKETEGISKEFKEMKNSISKEDLNSEIERIQKVLNEKENATEEKIQEILDQNKYLNSLNDTCYSLYSQYEVSEEKNIYEKSLDLFSKKDQSLTKNTGSWNIKIENENEKVIRI